MSNPNLQRLRKLADVLSLDMPIVPEDSDLMVRQAADEIERLRNACSRQNDAVCQTLGKALGYTLFSDDQANFPGATDADGVFVGEHVAETLAVEMARRYAETRAEVERLRGVMGAVASMPGRAWLTCQLALAEALDSGGKILDYVMSMAARAAGKDGEE